MAGDSRIRCTYLIDDLPSELDSEHCERVCHILASMDAQIFITCVDSEDIVSLWPAADSLGMFHVEQGRVVSVDAGETQ